jgi:diacylglycerol kinase family enzyme
MTAGTWNIRGVDLVHADKVSCRTIDDMNDSKSRVYVEADGELLGSLPVEVGMVPNALTILVP